MRNRILLTILLATIVGIGVIVMVRFDGIIPPVYTGHSTWPPGECARYDHNNCWYIL